MKPSSIPYATRSAVFHYEDENKGHHSLVLCEAADLPGMLKEPGTLAKYDVCLMVYDEGSNTYRFLRNTVKKLPSCLPKMLIDASPMMANTAEIGKKFAALTSKLGICLEAMAKLVVDQQEKSLTERIMRVILDPYLGFQIV